MEIIVAPHPWIYDEDSRQKRVNLITQCLLYGKSSVPSLLLIILSQRHATVYSINPLSLGIMLLYYQRFVIKSSAEMNILYIHFVYIFMTSLG